MKTWIQLRFQLPIASLPLVRIHLLLILRLILAFLIQQLTNFFCVIFASVNICVLLLSHGYKFLVAKTWARLPKFSAVWNSCRVRPWSHMSSTNWIHLRLHNYKITVLVWAIVKAKRNNERMHSCLLYSREIMDCSLFIRNSVMYWGARSLIS